MDLALAQLQSIFSSKPWRVPSHEFEQLIYIWLRLPRPERNAVTLNEYDCLWWLFFKAAFDVRPREMKDYLERSADPRAKDALEVLHWVIDGPWPVGPVAPFYESTWGRAHRDLSPSRNEPGGDK